MKQQCPNNVGLNLSGKKLLLVEDRYGVARGTCCLEEPISAQELRLAVERVRP